MCQNSAVGIVTILGVLEIVVCLPAGVRGFSTHQDTLTRPWSNHSSVQWVPEDLSTRKKWAGPKLGHLPPTNAEIKKNLNFAAIPPNTFEMRGGCKD